MMSFWAVYYHAKDISIDARKGFETRGSHLSNSRLTLQHLMDFSASSTEIIFGNISRSKRHNSLLEISTTQPPPNSFTVNYDDYGVDDDDDESLDEVSPCEQYYTLGKPKLPFNSIDFLAKIIFEVESFEKLFQLSTVKKLCELDTVIDKVAKKTAQHNFVSKIPFSFHFPYYTWCTNMTFIKSCNDLTQKNVDEFKSLVLSCLDPNTTDENCNTNIARQLMDYIFQRLVIPGEIPTGKIYIGAVSKVFNNFMVSAPTESRFSFYSTLSRELSAVFDGKNGVKLKGFGFFGKEILFEKELLDDVWLGIVSMAMVVLIIFLYSKSCLYTMIILFGMASAIGT
uniref:Uncharacterized protein n=1 Tax=Panagrolaimus sp. JU765 TaxID=591449 RepID=A0AC34QDC1_9BILA